MAALDIREELAPDWVINVFVFQKVKASSLLTERFRGALHALTKRRRGDLTYLRSS
jgi:hypothetical protein